MASNYTTNYQLNQWEAGDQVLRTEFNQDNQKIDAALKTNADAIAAETAARAALAETMAGKGNCQIYATSYVGTGGDVGMVTLTFPWPPTMLIIFEPAGTWTLLTPGVRYVAPQNSTIYNQFEPVWSGNTISWDTSTRGGHVMNANGSTFWVIAFSTGG